MTANILILSCKGKLFKNRNQDLAFLMPNYGQEVVFLSFKI